MSIICNADMIFFCEREDVLDRNTVQTSPNYKQVPERKENYKKDPKATVDLPQPFGAPGRRGHRNHLDPDPPSMQPRDFKPW